MPNMPHSANITNVWLYVPVKLVAAHEKQRFIKRCETFLCLLFPGRTVVCPMHTMIMPFRHITIFAAPVSQGGFGNQVAAMLSFRSLSLPAFLPTRVSVRVASLVSGYKDRHYFLITKNFLIFY
jgi:hypothetical protein